MYKVKAFFLKMVAMCLVLSTVLCTPAFAATVVDKDEENGVKITVTETENGTVIEGMVQPYANVGNGDVQPLWLAYGPITQHPSTGGTWQYGFWNAKVRSYYTVDRCHGSTVKLDDKESRSVDTAPGYKSIAELWAIQSNADDRYYYRVCD